MQFLPFFKYHFPPLISNKIMTYFLTLHFKNPVDFLNKQNSLYSSMREKNNREKEPK